MHLLGLVLLVGGIGMLDLRLAGAFRGLPVAPLVRATIPLALSGLVLLACAGSVMLAADAGPLAGSTVFRWKLAFIAFGLAHAVVFQALWRGRFENWDADPPPLGRLMAVTSIAIWLTVATLGRLIAYT